MARITVAAPVTASPPANTPAFEVAPFSYRVNPQGVVESVNVQTGLTTKEGGWIIDSGLNPGDVVVTSGVMKIRPGMTVKTSISAEDKPEEAVEG